MASILHEAYRLVHGPRQVAYGHPAEDFERIALIWTGILKPLLRRGRVITPAHVGLCMTGVKMSRGNEFAKAR